MKKAIKINLSGYIFHIDEDAYYLLQNYLDSVSRHGDKSDSDKEVLKDIESRIAELFKAKITDHYQVICIKDVKEVIDTVEILLILTDQNPPLIIITGTGIIIIGKKEGYTVIPIIRPLVVYVAE